MTEDNHLTTQTGSPIDNNNDPLTAGEYGPILLQDTNLIDKLQAFDTERIPERVVHAHGSGAFGYFELTADVSKYTKAMPFQTVGKRTPVFARFSTVGGEKGSADTERDPRGYSVKFYTEEGNWDMVGNNTPVFFIRDPSKFPDFIHTQKRNPQTNLKDPNMFWDFLSQTPESAHQVSILFSDRGTPDGYRKMNGFSSHTLRWVNKEGVASWVKFHFKTDTGIHNLTAEDAQRIKSTDADYSQRDLFEHIQKGNTASWTCQVQIMPEADGYKYKYNIFDVTKVWLHADYPCQDIGKLVFNRNPENYFQDVEQSAFSPGHLIPGIEPSLDKMLQARIFSYPDTHRHRLGQNHTQIPVNCPYRAKVSNGYRDGRMRVDGNGGSKPNYDPNTIKPYTVRPETAISQYKVQGMIGRYKAAHPNDDFAQPGLLFRKVFNDQQRTNIVDNVAGHLKNAKREIQERQLKIFTKCDPVFGDRLGQALGFPATKSKL